MHIPNVRAFKNDAQSIVCKLSFYVKITENRNSRNIFIMTLMRDIQFCEIPTLDTTFQISYISSAHIHSHKFLM